MNTFQFPDGMTAADFLATIWQRRPLLCPKALCGYAAPFDYNDFFDLACEPLAQSRLIVREAAGWRVQYGPLDPDTTDHLPVKGWSLLIQSMEVWVPELHDLIACFDFLPRWRIDDVMVSLSAEGGGVGPHSDQYDVFLFQLTGQRSWAYGGPLSPFIANQPLRLLSAFEPDELHVLEPGDVLYLPPGVPHDGIALDSNCVTLSIGFRAPGLSDIASKLADMWLSEWQQDAEHEPRFSDPNRVSAVASPTQIDAADAHALTAMIVENLADPDQAMRLAGELVSEPRMPPETPDPRPASESILVRLAAGDKLERWSGSRLAHGAVSAGRTLLFADGTSMACEPTLAACLSTATVIDQELIAPFMAQHETTDVLTWLVGQGSFGFPDEP